MTCPAPEAISREERRSHIAALADQCVMCGLCLPHCPTYGVARTEAESPRGRIAFAKNLATGHIAPTASVVEHLEQCLSCMSCERACPSGVRYGELLVETRTMLRDENVLPRRRGVSTNPDRLRQGLRAARIPGLRAALQSRVGLALLKPFGWDRAARELPKIDFSAMPKTATRERGSIGLFLGCAAEVIDRDVHAAAAKLLGALGYGVTLPRSSCCCGALALHAGERDEAAALATAACEAFKGVDTILVSASGCFGTLRDAFANTGVRVRDIHEFIAADDRLGDLRFEALPRRAALHTPCTQANVARSADAVLSLLRKIPQLDIAPLPTDPRCCGAAGSYFLDYPKIADTLRAEKLDQTETLRPDLLITSNVGCRIFLGNGLRQRGDRISVTHPIVLLAQQLQN